MNPLRLIATPALIAHRLAADVGTLAAFARDFGPWQAAVLDRADRLLAMGDQLRDIGAEANVNAARLIDVGEANAEAAAEMVELARLNVDGNRETNVAMRSLDARMEELLRFTGSLEQDLPALRASIGTMESLSESASAISEAAPPVQAAAARVERIAGRIPGMRDGR